LRILRALKRPRQRPCDRSIVTPATRRPEEPDTQHEQVGGANYFDGGERGRRLRDQRRPKIAVRPWTASPQAVPAATRNPPPRPSLATRWTTRVAENAGRQHDRRDRERAPQMDAVAAGCRLAARRSPGAKCSCCASHARTRAGAIRGSPASCSSSACASRRAWAGTSCWPPDLGQRPDARGRAGDSFSVTQAATMLACDFFTDETILLRRFYVLFFIEPREPSRASCRLHDRSDRLLGDTTSAELSFTGLFERMRFLIHDRDSKFSGTLEPGLPQRRDHRDRDADPLRGALRPHDPRRVSRLALDHRPPPPRVSPPHLHGPLQLRASSPRRSRRARPNLPQRSAHRTLPSSNVATCLADSSTNAPKQWHEWNPHFETLTVTVGRGCERTVR
jgi:hypothetical protein